MRINRIFRWFKPGQALFAGTQLQSNLKLRHYRNGLLLLDKDLGHGLVTNAGVNLWAADWNNATATLKLANYHDSGTGTTTPTVADVGLQTPTGAARIAGIQSTTSNVYQTQSTIVYGSPFAISEWGLFTAASGPTIFDHRTFSIINVQTGDTIQFTYQLSVISGG